MSWLTLSEADQKQWNVPERVEFDLNTIGIRSVQALKRVTGFTLEQAIAMAFEGKIVLVDGAETVEKDQDAYAALVWLILYASGHRNIPWDEFDPKGRGLGMIFDPADEGEDEAGKAPATDGSSTTTPS